LNQNPANFANKLQLALEIMQGFLHFSATLAILKMRKQ
jgi:hypothetical protein